MNVQYPVFTAEAECQDCYKCVRQCPVKAIRVHDGHAAVIPELCVACGSCVSVCPAKAKKVRDDIKRVKRMLDEARPVVVSLAPSWVSAWPELSIEQMVAGLQSLGFARVSETALGAEAVSASLAETLNTMQRGVLISSACPAAVTYIGRFLPELADCVTPMASPLLAHARLLKHEADVRVVFIGPCVAKKLEAERQEIDVALTFDDLKRWWRESSIEPAGLIGSKGFYPRTAREGAIYPIEGGMNETIRAHGLDRRVELLSVSGLPQMEQALKNFSPADVQVPVFIECLACSGGCVQGPSMSCSTFSSILEVRRRTEWPEQVSSKASISLVDELPLLVEEPREISEREIKEALRRVGKESVHDEMNCGGCGYDSCRHFARALLLGNAEPAMCVSYMRNQAQKKANALLRCIPSGVVIADKNLRVIECNKPFAEMFGEQLAFDVLPGMAGAVLTKILPFPDILEAAVRTGLDISRERLPLDERLLNVTIFSIEHHQTIGVIVQDVTQSEMKREQIARRAAQVIQKNMVTVQEIACRLGEHMADTEILLSSIAHDYGPEDFTPEDD